MSKRVLETVRDHCLRISDLARETANLAGQQRVPRKFMVPLTLALRNLDGALGLLKTAMEAIISYRPPPKRQAD
jgi:hypothetical protein